MKEKLKVIRSLPIVSVHIPKTAGSSFGFALQDFFGRNFYGCHDYYNPISVDKLSSHRTALEESFQIARVGLPALCVHGHCLPVKYLLLGSMRPITFVTWMRHPIARVISHYRYWMKGINAHSQPDHKRVFEEQWTFERFALGQEFRNYCSSILVGFPLECFSFIGIVEHYDSDLDSFAAEYINHPLRHFLGNVTSGDIPVPRLDSILRKEIETFHSKDMALYEQALNMRAKRIGR